MATCHKSWKELAIALSLLILVATAAGFGVLGTYWNQYDIKHGAITGKTYLIMANIFSVFGTFGAVAVASQALSSTPISVYILVLLMFLGLVVDLYFTMFAEETVTGDAFTYIVLGLNAIPRFMAILLGYGICTIPDAVAAVKVLGGLRRK